MNQPYSLDVIKVESPCQKDWNQMQGDNKVRFCDHCQKNVYNLSAMTRSEAEQLVCEKAGNLCINAVVTRGNKLVTLDYAVEKSPNRKWLPLSILSMVIAVILGGVYAIAEGRRTMQGGIRLIGPRSSTVAPTPSNLSTNSSSPTNAETTD